METHRSRTFVYLAMIGTMATVVAAPRPLPKAQQLPGYPGTSTNPQEQPTLGDQTPVKDEADARMEQQREKLAVDDRQKHLREDAARLVELSTELKTEVDGSSKFVTSVTAIRKAEEIEKLAHTMRDRMKN